MPRSCPGDDLYDAPSAATGSVATDAASAPPSAATFSQLPPPFYPAATAAPMPQVGGWAQPWAPAAAPAAEPTGTAEATAAWY